MFCRSTVAAADQTPDWTVYQGHYDGQELYARFNAALVKASDPASYSIQVGIALPPMHPTTRDFLLTPKWRYSPVSRN
jgi:hypothetical protein